MAKLKYLRTLTNQNYMPKIIRRIWNSVDICYHLVQNPLSSHLLPNNVKIKTYWTTVLSFVLYEHDIWSLPLREQHRQILDHIFSTLTRLWAGRSGVLIPAGAGDLENVQTGPQADPASYSVDMGDSLPGLKRLNYQADHSLPSSAELKDRYTLTPPICLHVHTPKFTVFFSFLYRLRFQRIWSSGRYFSLKSGEVIGQYRKLYNEELRDFNSSPNLIRVSNPGECHGQGMWHIQRDTIYTVLVGKPVQNRTFWRPGGRWKDNIKKVLKEKDGRHGLNSSGLEQEQMAGSCQHGNESSGSIKCKVFLN